MNNEQGAENTPLTGAENQHETGHTEAKLGSGPSTDIPNGGDDGAKQPKENTGSETKMGGSGGGSTGMGNKKHDEEGEKVQ